MIKNVVLLFLLAAVWSSTVYAQSTGLPVIRDSIYSNILKEERTLEIVLPDEYRAGQAAQTGVIYVTDGEWNTDIAAGIQQFLEIQFIPHHIIVGIDDAPRGKGNLRFRDLTPNHPAGEDASSGSGGGEAFLAFMTKELMPYINSKYGNNNKNILFGASLGGLFGMYALLKEPNAFMAYLLADPSFWWDKYGLPKTAREKLSSLPDSSKFLFIAGRSGKPLQGMGDLAMDSVLRDQARASLHWKSVAYSDETHNSMIFRTIYDGLKYIYWGYYAGKNLGFQPAKGFVLKDKLVNIRCFNDNFSDIYFTTDGSIPTTASTLVSGEVIPVLGGTKLTVKAICSQPEYSKTVSGDFQLAETFPTVAPPKSVVPGGLHYAYYLLKDTADLAHAKPVFSGRADSTFKFGKMDDPEKYICVFTGFIKVATEGYHILGSQSWGGTRLFLGKQLVIDQPDTDHVDFQASIVPLSSGYYPFRLEHILKQSQQKMELSYVLPEGVEKDQAPKPIPWQAFYAAKEAGN
jgi:predicted alpha/beta superfamily hydrolase